MKVFELLKSEVSVFKSCMHTNNNTNMIVKSIGDVLLSGEQFKSEIEELRKYSNKETAEIEKIYKLKKEQFPVWTPTCLCGNGAKDILKVHNIICIDIDLKDNPNMDSEKAKNDLIKLPPVFYASLSIGGKGIFCLMGLSGSDSFRERFEAVKRYIHKETGYVIDKSCSNPNRLRIISYDENPVFKDLNSEIVLFPGKVVENTTYKPLYGFSLPKRAKTKQNDFTELLDDDKFCEICADYCINRLGIQTTDYTNWLSHMGALSTLGLEGRTLAVQLSRQSPNFKSEEDVTKTIRALSKKSGQRQYLTRYFRLCKESLGGCWIQKIKEMYDYQSE